MLMMQGKRDKKNTNAMGKNTTINSPVRDIAIAALNKNIEAVSHQGTTQNLVEVRGLKQYFPVSSGLFRKGFIKAVEGVSFHIEKGETLGLVGESGCGKTTTGRSILRLYELTEGSIFYDGEDITKANMLPYRRKMQNVFQDPYASLNPRMTVGDIVGEPIDIHKLAESKAERREKIMRMLEHVGLNSELANRYPQEFSVGLRQRIGIARSLSVNP